jgi:DNA polymerase III delta prime subunit
MGEPAISGLRPLYLFDQLVIGAHNQFAVGACQEVLRTPGEAYNPLFIYGPPGVGKTHLMQAVAHQMLQQNPAYKIRYISAERFMSEVLIAISEDRMLEVRRSYSVLDLLIIDDVQYLTESKISQEELFHVFNNMHQANRQVILASDRPPNQLSGLNDNIRTRLEWGLATDVKIPDEATRLQILKRKQLQMPGLMMDDPMLIYVSQALKRNVRELEGFLKRIHAYVTLSHQTLSLDLVKTVVKEILPEGTPDPIVDLAHPAPIVASHALPPMPAVAPIVTNGNANGYHKPAAEPSAPPPPARPSPPVLSTPPAPPPVPSASPVPPAPPSAPLAPPLAPEPPVPPLPSESIVAERPPKIPAPEELMNGAKSVEPLAESQPPLPPSPVAPKPPASDPMTFEVLLQSMDQAVPSAPPPAPSAPPASPMSFFNMETSNDAAAVNMNKAPAAKSSAVPELKVVSPPVVVPPDPDVVPDDDEGLGHKDIGAVFFYPEGSTDALETVHRKFLDVIKKHKLKFRLKRMHSEPYAHKGKINYSSFVDVCKQNKVPVAIVIGPPADGGPHQDFYDLLTVTLDVQGVSLQLVNWSEINKDYKYLNLALDIALVRSR